MATPNSRKSAERPYLVSIVMLALLVFGSAAGAIVLSQETGRIAAIWVANAIALAYILKSSRRYWLTLSLVAFAANLVADKVCGDTLLTATVLSAANLLEVLIVAFVLQALKLHRDLGRLDALLVFYTLAAGPAPAISGILAALYLHWVGGADLLTAAVNWYASDSVGLSVIVPLLLTVRSKALGEMFARQQLATTLLCLSGVAGAIAINLYARDYPFAFLFFPAVLLATFVRGFEGGAIGLLAMAAYLIMPVLLGHPVGAIRIHPLREQLLIVQIYLAVTGFMVVLVGAALDMRRKLERRLAAEISRSESAREEALVAKDAAENANRMKSTFLATMSHELRTPLNAVLGFSDVMESELFGPLGHPRYREYVGMIRSAGQHLLDLINDILDMSKIEAGKHELNCEQIDVRVTVRDCMAMMEESAEQAQVALEEDLPSAPLWIEADPRAVKQILINLLSNAVKFTPAHGRIRALASADLHTVCLSISDTGIGIPADQIYRLGNPFVQVRRNAGASHAGSGLGLALVRALAEMHGGAFRIESTENVGTTVTVQLPIRRAVALAA